jgi:phospholipid-translocating ATPase
LVHLKCDEFVPADILALWSDEEAGQIFVETKSLDGETNLKIINVPAEINAKFDKK